MHPITDVTTDTVLGAVLPLARVTRCRPVKEDDERPATPRPRPARRPRTTPAARASEAWRRPVDHVDVYC
jgi:hypothetical protein